MFHGAFDGFDLLPPGLVPVADWPASEPGAWLPSWQSAQPTSPQANMLAASRRHTGSVRSMNSRTPTTIATDSANRRRATNPRTWRRARSSHWAPSTKHRSGRSSVTSASRLSAASATKNRLGASPDEMPERDAQRVPLRLRKGIEPAEHGAHS